MIEINAARLMVLRAAWEIDEGRDARDWISMVKIEAAETLGRVADRAVQIFGGMGYCSEMPIERLKEFSPAFGRDLSTVLTLESALARRAVAGGTAPAAVRAALGEFKARLGKIEEGQ